jgi:acid stress-induced BolA-like protein IbaG/YrbA
MNKVEIVQRVNDLHPDATIEAIGEDCSFELSVISDDFAGMNTLQRQQPILALFMDELASGELHALSVKAMTPEEQESRSGLVQL